MDKNKPGLRNCVSLQHFDESVAPGSEKVFLQAVSRNVGIKTPCQSVIQTQGPGHFGVGVIAVLPEYFGHRLQLRRQLEDLAEHRGEWVDSISIDYRGGVCLHQIPPNGQGLAALIALGLLREFDIAKYPIDSADCTHLQIEAMKIALS